MKIYLEAMAYPQDCEAIKRQVRYATRFGQDIKFDIEQDGGTYYQQTAEQTLKIIINIQVQLLLNPTT